MKRAEKAQQRGGARVCLRPVGGMGVPLLQGQRGRGKLGIRVSDVMRIN